MDIEVRYRDAQGRRSSQEQVSCGACQWKSTALCQRRERITVGAAS